jgi:hypothetical protein
MYEAGKRCLRYDFAVVWGLVMDDEVGGEEVLGIVSADCRRDEMH